MAGALGSILGGFGGGVIGGAVVSLGLDDSNYRAQLAKNEALNKAGASRAKQLWSAAYAGIALAAVAGVAATIKLTAAFEDTFTQIGALSNTSSAQLEIWKQDVLTLAGEVGKAPQELAEALYFLSSAGLRTSDVMDALGVAAKGSAVGLGETADVANIIASAMNAYSKAGLTATEVTDALVAAVKEGRAEPDAFATALGRILPIASKAGVGFDEVAASLASLSNIGLDVNEGVTAMRGLLTALEAPGTQASDMLSKLGLTADEVRATISEDGLYAALQLLEEAAGGDIDKLRVLVPNVRALTGLFGLTAQEAEKVTKTFDAVKNSAGETAQAFEETQSGPGQRLKVLLANLQVAAIRLGEVLLPFVLTLVDALASLAGEIANLLGDMKRLGILLGVLAAAWLQLNGGVLAWLGFAGQMIATTPAVVAGFAEIAGPIYVIYKGLTLANDQIDRLMAHDLRGFAENVVDGFQLIGIHIPDFSEGESDLEGWTEALKGVELGLQTGTLTAEAAKIEIERLAEEFRVGLPRGAEAVLDTLDATGGAFEDTATEARGMSAAAKKAKDALKEFQTTVSQAMVDAIGSVTDFSRKWELTARKFVNNSLGMRAKAKDLNDALRDLAKDKDTIPKPYLDYLLHQGPEAIVAFEDATDKQQRTAIKAWRGYQGLVNDSSKITDNLTERVMNVKDKIDQLGRGTTKHTIMVSYQIDPTGEQPGKIPGLVT